LYLNTLSNTYTICKTPLDEGSVRRRGLYLHTAEHSQEINIHDHSGIRNPHSQHVSGHMYRREKFSLVDMPITRQFPWPISTWRRREL